MPRLSLVTFVLAASLLALNCPVRAENIAFPPEAGALNVKDKYGAVGDGVADDTDALQKAIFENKGKNVTLYFPNGTYLVSRTLFVGGDNQPSEVQLPSAKHSRDRFVNFQGQSEAGTIIKLKDNCPEFQDPAMSKPILSLYDGPGTGDAMHNYVRNMTFDAGTGNPGANGLRYLANNTGAIYHVTIRSSDPLKSGFLGLDLRQGQNGPALIRDVTVEGFDRGVETQSTFALVFERLTLRDQKTVGFQMPSGKITIRGLTSRNSGPVIQCGKDVILTVVEGNFSGGSKTASAIICATSKVYVRDLKQAGYGAMVQDAAGTKIGGATLAEWVDGGGIGLFTKDIKSLRLPIKESPSIPWEPDFSKWQIVDHSQPDDTATLQQAIDDAAKAGKTTLFFTPGERKYTITAPIRVHGSLNRIIGMECVVDVKDPSGIFKSGKAVFNFNGLKSNALVVERFFLLGGWRGPETAAMFENQSGKTIILQSLGHSGSTKNISPAGEWFLDDVAPGRSGTLKVGRGEKIWARQLNPESFQATMIEVTGGSIWILGLKTEGRATHIIAKNRARVELLGGLSYQSWEKQPIDPPMFIVDNSAASLNFGVFSSRDPFSQIVQETKGSTKTLLPKDLINWHLGLYRSGSN